MRNKPGRLQRILCGVAIAAASIFNPLQAYSQEAPEKPETEQILEKKAKGKINIKINGRAIESKGGPNYLHSYAAFSRTTDSLFVGSEMNLTSEEKTEVEEIMEDIKSPYGDINSYQELIDSSKDLSERQKIVLLAAIGDVLNLGSYDHNNWDYPVFPQDIFFQNLQNYLLTGNENPLGQCGHIATHLERLANDAGIRSSAVTGAREGGMHFFVISKLDNGTAIIDYGAIYIVDTKNIEKALEAYQKSANAIMFQHLFFEDAKFKYRLTTKDGKKFLDFIGYDESAKTLKDSLTQKGISPSDIELNINLEDYVTSGEMNICGFFAKVGEIRGDSSSAIGKMELAQVGFKRKFSLFDFLYITPDASFITGTIPNDSVIGYNLGLTANISNETGFNLASRIARHNLIRGETNVSQDLLVGAGASYRIPAEKSLIIPYLTLQFSSVPQQIGTYDYALTFDEMRAGTVIDILLSDNTKLSFEPYYFKKLCEDGFGADARFKTGNLELNAGGYGSISGYDFCPNKWGVNAGLSLVLDKIKLGIDYKLEGTDYDREIENNHSLGVKGTFNF